MHRIRRRNDKGMLGSPTVHRIRRRNDKGMLGSPTVHRIRRMNYKGRLGSPTVHRIRRRNDKARFSVCNSLEIISVFIYYTSVFVLEIHKLSLNLTLSFQHYSEISSKNF